MGRVLQCESVQFLLEGLKGQRDALRSQLESLEQDVGRLKEWTSGLSERRTELQTSLTTLTDAVGQIKERTSAITKDFANKVCVKFASINTHIAQLTPMVPRRSSFPHVGELSATPISVAQFSRVCYHERISSDVLKANVFVSTL